MVKIFCTGRNYKRNKENIIIKNKMNMDKNDIVRKNIKEESLKYE